MQQQFSSGEPTDDYYTPSERGDVYRAVNDRFEAKQQAREELVGLAKQARELAC